MDDESTECKSVVFSISCYRNSWVFFHTIANGQPTQNNLMDLITEFGGSNKTDGENMTMMDDETMGNEVTNMSSMPFNMGVFVMPTTCTSPNELLGLMSGMFGSANGAGGMGGDNAT